MEVREQSERNRKLVREESNQRSRHVRSMTERRMNWYVSSGGVSKGRILSFLLSKSLWRVVRAGSIRNYRLHLRNTLILVATNGKFKEKKMKNRPTESKQYSRCILLLPKSEKE